MLGYLLSCGLLSNFLGSCPEKSNWFEEAEAQEAVVRLVSCYPTNSLQVCCHSFFTVSSVRSQVFPSSLSLWGEALVVLVLVTQTVAYGKNFAFLKRTVCFLLWLLFLLSCRPNHIPISASQFSVGRDTEAVTVEGGSEQRGFSLDLCPDWFS